MVPQKGGASSPLIKHKKSLSRQLLAADCGHSQWVAGPDGAILRPMRAIFVCCIWEYFPCNPKTSKLKTRLDKSNKSSNGPRGSAMQWAVTLCGLSLRRRLVHLGVPRRAHCHNQ